MARTLSTSCGCCIGPPCVWGVHGQEHSACGGKLPPERRRRSSRCLRDPSTRPGEPLPRQRARCSASARGASQQTDPRGLVGGTAGEPYGETCTVGRLAALTVPNYVTE